MREKKLMDKTPIVFILIAISCIAIVFLFNRNIYKNLPTNLDFPTLFIYMEEEDLGRLYDRDPLDDMRVEGSLKTSPKDRKATEVELRFRGDSTRYLPKKSFNIRFQEGQDFLLGSNRMNLNASYTDPSLMREKISMDMFKELGLAAPKIEYFNLYINNVYEGLYLQAERIDENLLSRLGIKEKGTLVRDGFITNLSKEEIERTSLFGYDISSVEDPETFLKENFSYRGEPSWQAVANLAEWVYNTPSGDDFYAGFQERFYLDEFIDWLAIHLLIGDIDSFANDYWLYLDDHSSDAKWRMIPWDKDLSFGSTYRPQVYVDNDFFAYEYDFLKHTYRDNDIIKKFFETPQLQKKLFSRMEHLMEEVFTLEYFENKTAALREYIEDSLLVAPSDDAFILHAQNHHGELGRLDEHIEAILDFVALRYQFIRRQIHPVEGDNYIATVNLKDYKKGDIVYFTDAEGWTIAKLHLQEILKQGSMTITVEHKEEIKGINRIWRIIPEEAEVLGDLTLYYRNEIYDFGKQNWYEEKMAIGDQWNLVMASYQDGEIDPMPSKNNPYSNKITTAVYIKDTKQLVITY